VIGRGNPAAGNASLVPAAKQIPRSKVGERMATHDTCEHAADQPGQHEPEHYEDNAGHHEGRQCVTDRRAHSRSEDRQPGQDEHSLDTAAPAPPGAPDTAAPEEFGL
jgi:hypothetical protein